MIKTMFYTFFRTKHQEENANNDQILPQEIDIRPITPCPWDIIKTLSPLEVGYRGRLQLPMVYIQATILRHIPDLMSKTHMKIGHFALKVKDLDTNTVHTVSFWKVIQEDNFSTRETWIKEFVKRRSLEPGMVVGMYWDFNVTMLCFSVLEMKGVDE
ncbi:B3 domain-containing protein [Raphanus sativus]|uniref:B3 domain-containing protein At5g26805 n=1 Tax=Raphanus sativus TaxID=3726 RepID=A0A6J0JJ02_RAPSA|nr:B3 domain-containing protein At5g26805 [Raphanus sativus]KAJ4887988.1 B3 domain-containing protein [Raphanus sativus]